MRYQHSDLLYRSKCIRNKILLWFFCTRSVELYRKAADRGPRRRKTEADQRRYCFCFGLFYQRPFRKINDGIESICGDANLEVGYEKNFYTIDEAKIVNKSAATGITDYENNNGIASLYPAGNSGNANYSSNSHNTEWSVDSDRGHRLRSFYNKLSGYPDRSEKSRGAKNCDR